MLLAWVWQPVIPPLHLVGGMMVLAGLSLFAYIRTMSGRPIVASFLVVMRLMLVVALSILLMGPSRLPPETRSANRPRLSILLDTSESMQSSDCEGTSRIDFAVQQILSPMQLATLGLDYRIELVRFDEKISPLSPTELNRSFPSSARGKATCLSESLVSTLSQISHSEEGAIVCVISDGKDTQDAPIEPAASLAKSRKVPVYAIGLGGQTLQPDMALLAVPTQEYLMPGEPGSLLVKVYQSGLGDSHSTLRVRQGDQVRDFPIAFNHKSVVELQVPIQKEEEGHYEYAVSVDPLSGEKELTNNQQVVFCDVVKKRIRVLMLEGQPYWDSKFLAQSLRKDDRIELTQITQLSPKKKETIVTRVDQGTPQVPTTQEEWDRYDIVILGQSMENVLDQESASQLQTFVSDHGGHLIFSRGQSYTPGTPRGVEIAQAMEVLEPVVWGLGQLPKVSLSLTPAGRTSPWFSTTKMGTNVEDAFSRLPGFELMPVIEREKPATIVLARASKASSANLGDNSQPAIVRMNYGRGIIVGLLGKGLWQWSLLSPERQDLVGFYDTFWSNLIRWLSMGGDFAPGQLVALQLDRSSLRLGSQLLADVVFRRTPPGGAPPTLTLKHPTGETRIVTMAAVPGRESRYRAQIDPDTIGVYQLSLNMPDAIPEVIERKFNVYDVNLERLDASANPLSLKIVAEHTGGKFLDSMTARELPELLRRHRTSMIVPPRLEYIWDHSLVMSILLIWAGLEWLIRRCVGLL